MFELGLVFIIYQFILLYLVWLIYSRIRQVEEYVWKIEFSLLEQKNKDK